MNNNQIDDHILSLLNDLRYFSRMRTCLQIRLSDYAAQQCGCRSTRQIPDSYIDDVEEQFTYLMSLLIEMSLEIKKILSKEHSYNSIVTSLNNDDLEIYLENTLFDVTTLCNIGIFKKLFFE